MVGQDGRITAPKVAAAPWNVFVEGDNLDVLRDRSSRARVDLVYIDPPYNTGNDFAYATTPRRPAPAWRPGTRPGPR